MITRTVLALVCAYTIALGEWIAWGEHTAGLSLAVFGLMIFGEILREWWRIGRD